MSWQGTIYSHHTAEPMRLLAQSCAFALVGMLFSTDQAAAQYVPYFPTPQPLVNRMLEMAEVKQGDFLIDLGCGDGRIPVTAAQRYGSTGLGVDFEAQRIVEANENARKAGVVDKVTFRKEDLFDTDISNASVLTLYLSLSINIKLRPRILQALKPGARVLSHDFNMGDWLPDKTERISGRVVYLWIVPAKVAGNWQLTYDGSQGASVFELMLEQQFQQLDGKAMIDGKSVLLRDALVTGDRVSFALDRGERSMRFDGRMVDGRVEGHAEVEYVPKSRRPFVAKFRSGISMRALGRALELGGHHAVLLRTRFREKSR
jgi:SAM-dependent methyltransferase